MTDLVPLQTKVQYANQLAASNLLPRAYQKNPANVLVAVEFGEALGFSPLQAMSLVHVIEGKPTLSAQAIGGLVRRAGHRLRVVTDDAKMTVEAQVIRCDDPDFVFKSVWTMDRARAANLTGKGVWKSYPLAMLKARAITEVARDACPEALFGVSYTAEELGAESVDENGAAVEVVSEVIVATRTVKDAFLEACRTNDIDPADIYRMVGDDDITDENIDTFRAAVKGIIAARKATAGSPKDDRGEGDAAPADAGSTQSDGVNDEQCVEASPLPIFSDDVWMVPVCPEDRYSAPLTKQQQVTLMALSATVFGNDRNLRLAWACDATGRNIATYSELTEWEATHMIERLTELKESA